MLRPVSEVARLALIVHPNDSHLVNMLRFGHLLLIFVTACPGDADDLPSESSSEPSSSSESSSTDAPTTSGSSGEPSICGDGVHSSDEECDDDTLCKDCIRDRLVFVTNSFHQPSLELAGADAICQREADEEGLDGVFLAWLSVRGSSPLDRFVPAPGRYAQRDGSIVAESWQAFVDGERGPIIRGPHSEDWYGRSAWTGTTAEGAAAAANCNGWTAAEKDVLGGTGLVGGVGAKWTDNGAFDCRAYLKLYCFEQG